jgi:hypothetical protein
MRHVLSILSIFTVLAPSTLHAQVPSYVPTNGLVGWWPFNGNANDESGNGNNGTVNGATLTEDRLGVLNSCYVFDGINDNIICAGTNIPSITSVSVSVWIKPFENNGIAEFICLGSSSSTTWGTMAGTNWNGSPYQTMNYGRGCSGTGVSNVAVEPFINNWQHITYISSGVGGICSVYVNGNFIGQSNNGTIGACSSTNLYFGVDVFGPNYINCVLDDIGIWNRALTPAEVQALYNAQSTPCVSPDPVSFTGLGSSYTLADAPVTLSGTPAGGVFIGPGVSGSTFSPAAAGVGTHGISYTYLDGNNCVNTFSQCTEVTINAGIGGNAMTTGGVRVFPNPNRGQFTVELELTGLVGLQVFDARGALVHNEVFTASGSRTERTLDLSAFAIGSYTLQVEHDGQRVSQTVVVE